MRVFSSKYITYLLCILFALALFSTQAQAAHFFLKDTEGHTNKIEITKVFDGDSFASKEQQFRLWGIDTPEKGEKHADNARRLLTQMLDFNMWNCEQKDIDKYDRIVVHCTTKEDLDLGGMLVEMGLAKELSHFSKGFYTALEGYAKHKKKGIWAK